MQCAMGVGGSTVISTAGAGWCTPVDWRNIGDAGIVRCRSASGIFCLDRTSRVERTGVLRWGDFVADAGVARGVNTLGGGGTGTGWDVTGGGTTLRGSIAVVTGVGCGMGGGCSGCNLAESRGIDRGYHLLNISRSLMIAMCC